MPLKLSRTDTVPPGGYRYYIEKTQRWVASGSLAGLVEETILHLQTNNLPVPSDIASVVEDAVCQGVPATIRDKVCYYAPGSDHPPVMIQRVMTWRDISNFLSVLKSWATKGGGLVDKEQAYSRSEICAACPLNIRVAGCPMCHDVANKLTQLIGGNKTGLEEKLQGCGVCGCDNRAQVWFPLEVLAQGVTPDMEFPEWCWKKKAKA